MIQLQYYYCNIIGISDIASKYQLSYRRYCHLQRFYESKLIQATADYARILITKVTIKENFLNIKYVDTQTRRNRQWLSDLMHVIFLNCGMLSNLKYFLVPIKYAFCMA